MAFISTTREYSTGNPAEILYRLKEELKLAGWVVKSSSDGTTYNASSDIITGFGAGAGGMNNSRAWFRIAPADNHCQRTYQIDSNGATRGRWRIKRTPGTFSSGAPAATVTPSDSIETIESGGGTDAAPTFGQIVTNAAVQVMNIVCENVAPYRYWHSSNAMDHSFTYDYVVQTLQKDPYVTQLSVAAFGQQFDVVNRFGIGSATPPKARYNHTLGSAANVICGMSEHIDTNIFYPGDAVATSRKIAVDAYDSIYPLLFGYYKRTEQQGNPQSIFGRSSLLALTPRRDGAFTNYQMLNVDGGDRNAVLIYEMILPWPPGVGHSLSAAPFAAKVLNGSLLNPLSEGGLTYRMRGYDTVLTRNVYWNASTIDSTAASYTTPGNINLSTVTVSKVIGT
jgi:hypothetical protein